MSRRSMGASVPENVLVGPMTVSTVKSARTRGTCPSGCWPVRGGCDCNYAAGGGVMRAVKSALSGLAGHGVPGARAMAALSGISGGPRGNRVSMWAMGDPAIYTGATKCSEIPSGDPYRAPGNFCTGNDGSQKAFDAQGNAISTGPDITTLALYAAGALVAYKVLFKKKR